MSNDMNKQQNNQQGHTLSDDELEALLDETEFVEVPQQFTNKVMQEIDELPDAVMAEDASSNYIDTLLGAQSPKSEWWQWVALVGGGIPALLQILAFIFSAWNVASLG